MKTKIFTLLSILFALLFFSCSKEDYQQIDNTEILGTWSYIKSDSEYAQAEDTYIFDYNNNVTRRIAFTVLGVPKIVESTWKYEYYGDKLIIIDSEGESNYKCHISRNYMTLISDDGESRTYTKQ